MKRIFILVLIIVGVFLLSQPAFTSSYIYNEVNGVIYIGGYPLENIRRDINGLKHEELYFKNKIYVINTKDGTSELFLKTDESILAYEISNQGYIAVSTSKKDRKKREFKNDLIIYESNGEKVKLIENVPVWIKTKHFSWSKADAKIAYITGKVIIEGHYPFEPTGVWLYDIENGKTTKIADTGVKINWSRHDNNIYIQNKFDSVDPTDISIYNTSTGKLTKSDRKGIIFSDDGKYYIGIEEIKGYDFPTYVPYIFDNISNKKNIYSTEEKSNWHREMMLRFKFINNSQYLLVWGRKSYKIINVETVKVVRKADKQGLVGWNKDMTKVVVYEGGNQIHIDELLTGRRLQSIDIPESRH